jgi:hypothetical protein
MDDSENPKDTDNDSSKQFGYDFFVDDETLSRQGDSECDLSTTVPITSQSGAQSGTRPLIHFPPGNIPLLSKYFDSACDGMQSAFGEGFLRLYGSFPVTSWLAELAWEDKSSVTRWTKYGHNSGKKTQNLYS